MIKVNCFTNIDDASREVWPKFMLIEPKKGDTVRATSGRELCIVAITHPYIGINTDSNASLFIELHNRRG